MTIAELLVKIGFKFDGTDKLPQVEKQLNETAGTAGKLALGIDAITAGMGYLIDTAMNAAVGLNQFHLATGLSAESLQEMQYNAKLANVSTSEMMNTVKNLQKIGNDIRLGKGDAQPWVAFLGLDPTQDPNKLIAKLRASFSSLTDAQAGFARNIASQAGISDTVFAWLRTKPGPDEVLPKWAELTDQNTAALVALNREWQKLEGQTGGEKNKFISELAPALTSILVDLEPVAREFGKFVFWLDRGSPAANAVKDAIVGLGVGLAATGTILTTFAAGAKLAALATDVLELALAPLLIDALALGAALTGVYLIFKQIEDFRKAHHTAPEDVIPSLGGKWQNDPSKPWLNGGMNEYFTPANAAAAQGNQHTTVAQSVQVTIPGAGDPHATARAVKETLDQHAQQALTAASVQAPAFSL